MKFSVNINFLIFRYVEFELMEQEFRFIVWQLPWWDLKYALFKGRAWRLK